MTQNPTRVTITRSIFMKKKNGVHYYTERSGMEWNSSVTLFYGTELIFDHVP